MMLVECVAILAVLAIFTFMVARSGHRTVALALLPLLLVPSAYLLSAPLSSLLLRLIPAPRATLAAGVTVLGLVVSCVLFGMLCGNFTRRVRRVYLIMCGGFSALLTAILLHNLFAILA